MARRRAWIAFWTGAFAVVLAVVLIVVLAPGPGHDHVVAPRGDRALVKHVPVAWSASTDEYDDEHPFEPTLRQAWVVDGAVVRAGTGAVRSFDAATGELNWETPIPKHRRVCGSSVSRGTIAAIAYGTTGRDDYKQCDHVLVVDVRTGEVTQDIAFDLRTEGDPAVDVLGSALYVGLPLQTAPDKPYGAPAELRRIDGRSGLTVRRVGRGAQQPRPADPGRAGRSG